MTEGPGDGAPDSVLAAFLRSLPFVVSLKDASGRIRFLSDETLRTYGRAESPTPETLADLFPPELAEELDAADRRVRETGELVTMPMWMPDNAGGRRHLAMLKFPVHAGEEMLVGTIAINITPFSSTAWDASTYKQILDAISDLILVKNPKSKLMWANKALLDAYGMSNADLQGILDAPFVEPDVSDSYVKHDMQVVATGTSLDIPEEPMKWADGQTRIVHTVKSPIFDENGKVKMMVAVIRDITDRKRMEAELRQAQKLESLGRLAAGMAHEINTPIQFVGDQRQFAQSAFEDLLRLVSSYQGLVTKVEAGTASKADVTVIRAAEEAVDLAYLRDGLASSFNDMADGVRRVAQLVQALKEFGHPDQGMHEHADLNAAIRRTVVVATNEYRYVAEMILDLHELPPTPCSIGELQQVFLNLIINAAHAIADRMPSDVAAKTRGTIRIATRYDDEFVTISISDTGCGIPPELRGQIFDPFFTTKSVGRGTGQGLAIARMVVDKHHGSITFDSEVGLGTTFRVRIPRSAPAE